MSSWYGRGKYAHTYGIFKTIFSAILLNECIYVIIFYCIKNLVFILTHRVKAGIILKFLMTMPVEVCFKGDEKCSLIFFFLEFIILSNFLAVEECLFWDDMQLRSTNPPKLIKNHVINICENRTTFRFSQGDITWGNFNCPISKLLLAFVVKYFVTILIKIHKNINEFI